MKTLRFITIIALLTAFGSLWAGDIPTRPEDIHFKDLKFDPPQAKDYRHKLKNGVSAYLIESHEFPLIQINFSFKGGRYLEPADLAGLAGATGSMMRRGGTATVPAEEMDETFDFLATNASTNCRELRSGASLNTLKSNLDESLALFMDMVRNPGFQEDKFKIYKEEVLEEMKQRNDDASDIQRREWAALLYGRDHYKGRISTQATLGAITVDDMRSFHAKVFHPGNLVVTVVGDFQKKDMLNRLNKAFQGWEAGEKAPDPPAPPDLPAPGLYHIEKDIPQAKVYMAMPSLRRDDPDAIPYRVMNEILGGGGFISRITKRVRSDEGLSYGAGTYFDSEVYFPGTLLGYTDTKNPSVAFALSLFMEEFEKIRTGKVTQEELDTVKNSFIETFPRTFESKQRTASTFANDELTGRDPAFWKTYRDKVRAVTADDVLAMAQKHITPGELVIFIVGKWDEVAPGDEHATMADFYGGEVKHLPLRDPLTQEPIAE